MVASINKGSSPWLPPKSSVSASTQTAPGPIMSGSPGAGTWHCFFLAVLGLHDALGISLVVENGGYSLVAVCGRLFARASLGSEHRL